MSLTKIGSIGINTGIQFAGVTTVSTLHVGSGVTLSSDGDVFFTGIITGNGSGLTNLTGIDLVNDTTPQLGGNLDVNTKNITFGDSGSASDDRLTFGAGTDLSMYHDGSDSYISHNGTGNFYVQTSEASVEDLYLQAGNDIYLRPQTGDNGIKVIGDGAVELYYDNSKKLETTSIGVTLSGDLKLPDNEEVRLGDGNDLQLYHNGSQSYVTNNTGNLNLTSAGAVVTKVNTNEDAIVCNANGSVDLYHDNEKKIYTHATGIQVEDATSTGASIVMSTSSGTSGSLYATGDNTLGLLDGQNHYMLKGVKDGALELYYDNSKKAETFGSGLKVSGGGELYIDGNAAGGHCQLIMTRSDVSYMISNETYLRLYTQSGNQSSPSNLIAEFTNTGHFRPGADNSYDLGDTSRRWRNLYTTDLQLSNEGKTNDVDGTWGNYTIQEGESDLFLINNRSGKKYKFNLTEVS